jgi:hypothetical protein
LSDGIIFYEWLLLMPSKGITLPVNSVIIIALAIFVLLMLAAFFGKSSNELTTTQVTNAFNQGCSQLSSSYNCDYEKLPEIKTSLISNGEAKSLLDVCRMSFNNPSMSAFKCKKACQVCPNKVYRASHCETEGSSNKDEDCISPLTPNWQCRSTNGVLGCYSPLGDASINEVTSEGLPSN